MTELPPPPPDRLDPHVPHLAELALTQAAKELQHTSGTLGEIGHYAEAVSAAHNPTDRDLAAQVLRACHSAIALVFVSDYKANVVTDPHDTLNPDRIAAGVMTLLAEHPVELHPYLAFRAATLIGFYNIAD